MQITTQLNMKILENSMMMKNTKMTKLKEKSSKKKKLKK